ncbi:hypothetical protein ACOI1C_02930 [Bacillus sp. DJP31]|uniref:hypothetical protein n=1 Tax=Bacillus sp. DJP31 TaxID=3409789 RepID=UPI003BB7BEC3
MRGFFLLFILSVFLIGCSAKGKEDPALLPREYYRSIISADEIGAAFSKSEEATEGLIPLLLMNEKISHVVFVKHEGESMIGLRLNPYYRHGSGEVIQEISSQTTIKVSNIVEDPRKYRVLERLYKEKQMNEVSDVWLKEWNELRK